MDGARTDSPDASGLDLAWTSDGVPRSPRYDDVYVSRSGVAQAARVFVDGRFHGIYVARAPADARLLREAGRVPGPIARGEGRWRWREVYGWREVGASEQGLDAEPSDVGAEVEQARGAARRSAPRARGAEVR